MNNNWKKHRARSKRRGRGSGDGGELREGVIQHHGHFAFMLTETEGESDVLLRGHRLRLAMDGDRVRARVRRKDGGRMTGELVEVVSHARTTLAGTLRKVSRGWLLVPEKGDAPPAQVTRFVRGAVPQEGFGATMEITRWPTEEEGPAGRVTEVLGDPEDIHVRIGLLLRARDFAETFPKAALAESDALPAELSPKHWRGREELFHLPVVTIDGADAKDFDDAVSVEPLGGGKVRLGVHIADVAHYVKPGSALDDEAYRRATSVYLPDRVVPMLPPSLSNNLCSLVPYRERLTMSVFMDIDKTGRVLKRRLAQTVIRSARRFTYEEVETLLEGGKVSDVPPAVLESVKRMGGLAKTLTRSRFMRGSLDFDLPEYKIRTDEDGDPVDVVLRSRLQSHRLVEEFMLLANEAIATELMAARMPFLHRRHDAPDPEKIKTLARTLGDMGIPAGELLGGDLHKSLQSVLRRAEKHPLSELVSGLIVRSMQQAIYSPESTGHFGIAARAYAHFTSPIRRYPDLTAHRAVKALLQKKKEKRVRPLAEAGAHCSERERSAAEAEYKAVDIMRAELFKENVGAEMDGMVMNSIESGSFVLLGDTGAEGMLRGMVLKPGTKVRVVVEAVDTAEGKIDLSLPGGARSSAPRRGKRPGRAPSSARTGNRGPKQKEAEPRGGKPEKKKARSGGGRSGKGQPRGRSAAKPAKPGGQAPGEEGRSRRRPGKRRAKR